MHINRICDALDQVITRGKILNFMVDRIKHISLEKSDKQGLHEALLRLENATSKINEAIQAIKAEIANME